MGANGVGPGRTNHWAPSEAAVNELREALEERQQAGQALRESEEHFRTMANTAPLMVWRAGADALRDFFNKPWLEFRGRPLDRELGNGWIYGVHVDDLDGCRRTYGEAFDARQAFQMEYRLRRFDGKYRWVLDSGARTSGPTAVLPGT